MKCMRLGDLMFTNVAHSRGKRSPAGNIVFCSVRFNLCRLTEVLSRGPEILDRENDKSYF